MKKIYYGKAVYDNKEINAVLNVLKNHSLNLIDGPHVKKLEKIVAKIFLLRYPTIIAIVAANIFGLFSKSKKRFE